MEYWHVKNIEKYNSGHKDRQHIWAKLHYKAFLDEKFQELDEIDRYRFWSLIVFENYHQKPIAMSRINLALLGWDIKKRPIYKTQQMLHTLIEVCSENVANPLPRVEESRVEESRIDKSSLFSSVWTKYPNKLGKSQAIRHFNATINNQKDFEDINKALDNYLRTKEVAKGFIKHGSTWFNQWRDYVDYKDPLEVVKVKETPDPNCNVCSGSGKVDKAKCFCWGVR
jgi:hypothetical protein